MVVKKTLVLSANKIFERLSETLGRSFTYNKNNKGPKMEPCGKPH